MKDSPVAKIALNMLHESLRPDEVSGTCGQESHRPEIAPAEALSETNQSIDAQPEGSHQGAALGVGASKFGLTQNSIQRIGV